MGGVFEDLINNLQCEADEHKTRIIGMLGSTSRDYDVLNKLMDKYIECRDAADVLKQESISRME